MDLTLLQDPQTYISLGSLALLEIVLGIDNIIFISILAGKLPVEKRQKARVLGLAIALIGRLILLSGIAWLTQLTKPLITVMTLSLSGKDLVLLAGGLFLIAKSAHEIYERMEGDPHEMAEIGAKAVTFASIIAQIVMIDVVFSLDSIITAVGLVSHIGIMVTAILISLGVMIAASGSIGDFIDRHPSVKILALSFLLMIGTMLVAEAFGYHVPKGYIYFSLAFGLFVEFINIRAKIRSKAH
jgi:predicted tellurium resistance membrane protein TerC